ncbi:S-layer homology domain-containing protein [Paenibacillus kobensis]|uniref:S-layer homology domain-containing protein n=1 Tax=Paenibacillus kobensis TaxID=59841 RepID=UPI001FE7DCBE|nr:S-layer homology domain-containing protein [Paenibacillus kobensis]
MKKTMISAALALAIAVPFAGNAFAAGLFNDIGGSAAQSQIETLQSNGIVHGVTAEQFRPGESLTAAQGVTLIVRSMQLSLAAISFNTAPTAEGYFEHVSNSAWYADDFVIAKANGLDIPSDIDPKQPLKREQFVHWLVQGLEKTGQYPLIKMYINIADEADLTTEYQGTVQRALLYKLTALDAEGNFKPQAVVTREEASVMVYNAVQFVEAHQEPVVEGDQPAAGSGQPVTDGSAEAAE